jgi:hypothetical protein
MNGQPLDALPLWGLYLLLVLVFLAASETGFRVGTAWTRRWPSDSEGSGVLVGATLGFMAFSLAFLIGIAVNRFDDRRRLVVEDANAIGTTYLRAGFLSDQGRLQARDLLGEYVDDRVLAISSGSLEPILARSSQIHAALWTIAEAEAASSPQSLPVSLFIEALNHLIDTHERRAVVVTESRIPATVFFAILIVALLSVFLLGVHNRVRGRRNVLPLLALALALSVVILLIVDLDRPSEGLLRVSQRAMLDLQAQVHGGP